MELARHESAPVPYSVIAGASLFQTQDVEEARQWGVRTFCESTLNTVSRQRSINARLHLRKVRGVGFGRITYGGEVNIDPGSFESFYLVQVPLSGRELVEVGGEAVCSAGKNGSVINANAPVLIRHEPNTEKLVVRVDREALERNCIQHLGHGMRRPLEFRPSMSLDSQGGMRWTGLMRWIYESLAIDEQSFDPAIIAAQIEQMVITMLLTCQPHNYSEELAGEERSIAPAFVKRIERYSYIEEHADEPITIVDLAEHAGVSSRSIFNGFRRFRNTSPMLYLKEVRMRRVNEELKRLTPGETTVTAVAYQWGFTHLGHFTTDYKRRFGESPSQTLAR
ncbi:AraC family transcriptional regulator [Thauera sinica]|uniref:AraC family transcriptional regulator n=1 Tax=Thauera sinica TaxID=2665146 RepID=A0ABW1ALJ0_9RHOO|nr:AraC family transcriptional regulator [Thauera sp. K11]ATE62087.1 AraC family transcriptional regulator [Thauera sp. K11]